MNKPAEPILTDRSVATERIGLSCRREIKWTRSVERGEVRFVASDPLKADHFSCSEADYHILQWVAVDKTYQQVCDQFHQHFRPATLQPIELKRLLWNCLQSGVLQTERGSGLERRAQESSSPTAKRKPIVRLASSVVNLVQYQMSFGSPGWFLDVITKPLSNLFATAFLPFAILLFAFAVLGIAYRWDEFWIALPSWAELRAPSALIGYGLIFFATRLFHELGHATACRRFNLECRDVGLLVSFGMICPYVDISEGWKSKNRFHRLITAFGGIYFELLIASVAALIWCFTTSSLTHTLCYQTLLVCSLTTLLFNANPMMKYDGYYIMSDALGINNLRDKSWRAFDRLAGGKLDKSLTKQLGLCGYFIGSLLNRLTLLVTLAWFVYRVAGDWQITGVAVTAIFLYGLCAAILWVASWTQQSQATGRQIPLRAQIVGWAGTACVAIWAMTLPLPKRTWGVGSFKPGDTIHLYSVESGIIQHELPIDGKWIQVGDPILELRSRELNKEQLKLQSELAQSTAKLKSLDGSAFHNTRLLDQKKAAESQLRVSKIQNEEIDRRMETLSIKATHSGVFRANPPNIAPDDGLLKQASYQSSRQPMRFASLSPGAFLPKNTMIGSIVTNDDPHIECEISKDQIESISISTPVAIRLSTSPDKILKGMVSKVSSATVSESNPNLPSEGAERAIGKMMLRIDCDELRTIDQVYGQAELVFHHFDQSMWDYLVDAVLRNTRWR